MGSSARRKTAAGLAVKPSKAEVAAADDLQQVARRLRAVRKEFKFRSVKSFGEALGVSRSVMTNWLSGLVPPQIEAMKKLKSETGITLDWIYTGDSAAMDTTLLIRLTAILDYGEVLKTKDRGTTPPGRFRCGQLSRRDPEGESGKQTPMAAALLRAS